jgi:hypothetical protein
MLCCVLLQHVHVLLLTARFVMCLIMNRLKHADSAVIGALVATATNDVQPPPSKRRKELHAGAVAAKQLGKSLSVS